MIARRIECQCTPRRSRLSAGRVAAARILSGEAAFHRRRLAAARVYAYCPPPDLNPAQPATASKREVGDRGRRRRTRGRPALEWNATYKDARGIDEYPHDT